MPLVRVCWLFVFRWGRQIRVTTLAPTSSSPHAIRANSALPLHPSLAESSGAHLPISPSAGVFSLICYHTRCSIFIALLAVAYLAQCCVAHPLLSRRVHFKCSEIIYGSPFSDICFGKSDASNRRSPSSVHITDITRAARSDCAFSNRYRQLEEYRDEQKLNEQDEILLV